MICVVDASFIASLFLPDESNAAADKLMVKIKRGGAAAPGLLQLELTNIVLMAKRRKRISGAQLSQLSAAIDQLPVTLHPALTPTQRSEVLAYADKHGLTAYDAAYLELATRLGLSIATLDEALAKAAKAEGVAVAL